MTDQPLLSVCDISFRYDITQDVYALSAISFDLNRGESLAVIGDNGSGKSTLARLLTGLLSPEKGAIYLDGVELNEGSKKMLRRQMGIVFQNPDNQFIATSVEDDVAFGLENLNIPYEQMRSRVDEALELVDMYEYRTKDPSQLSGGQKQRVALAGVLALKPELMIFDEAFVMLDPMSRRSILETLRRIQSELNVSIISITHDRDEIEFFDSLLVLNQGERVMRGKPAEVFKQMSSLKPPFAEQLRRDLVDAGMDLPDYYMSESELVDTLCK
ncbi:energy-coupling factor transport system ATP-binding protein [Pelagirhabdus alkalitolerans]|uniref:Energy-coupling factor transport system ATP-binding protein n=1 Tax=Pelagirhabdus alkalitolerans TaxID=1612202 RepID=A0A1G6MHR1_9BACI|nr:energy-coupling factor transporter ATPase [Pelagirhabdus alkalitolerans]SDC54981.1 energy-coupling factor transport system ATP-binding protein [Pelagirhabdus alkalitolerans]